MEAIRRNALFAALLAGFLVAGSFDARPAQARCCDVVDDGCTGASETGCAMGAMESIFFPNPCECSSGECIDPTMSNEPCGGTPPANCGDGMLQMPESCDDGAANGTFMSCCAVDCTFKVETLCDDGTFCDGLGLCDGSGTCVENSGGQICPDPTLCVEETNSCGSSRAPTVSAGLLGALASLMVVGSVPILRRRRRR